MRYHFKKILWILPALFIYAYLCHQLNFTQDDAYISYRYVANYLDGHGLVYNIGDRIEGFTNFGWVIYLVFWGALGLGYVLISKVTGFLLGAGIVVLTYLISRHVFTDRDEIFRWFAVYFVAINQSLAYWSPAGLETAAFAFMAFASLLLYLKRSWLLILSLTLGVLLRPEGAVAAFALMLIEIIESRRAPLFTGRCVAMALLFSLPLVGFKLAYYGSILPNPFYAKTELSITRLVDGLEYAGRFLVHYGLYGAVLVLPVAFFKKLSRAAVAVWVFFAVYLIYIIIVGGDVLKVHRFFLPVIGATSLLLSLLLWLSVPYLKARQKVRVGFSVITAIAFGVITFITPRSFVLQYNQLEKRFTANMEFLAQKLKAYDSTDFSVALPTIGVFGYTLVGHDIIDMLGLTDSMVAKHPAPVDDRMASTWKERKYNSAYILGRRPDYIMFSTGIKPSAPAEKSLLLYRHFLEGYRSIGWVLNEEEVGLGSAAIGQVFQRVRDIEGNIVAEYPLEFVELYKRGLDVSSAADQREAIYWFDMAIKVSPEPVYIYLLESKAMSYVAMRQYGPASVMMDSIVATDSMIFMAHAQLLKYAILEGNQEKADIHRRWLRKLVPWYLPRVEAKAALALRNRNQIKRR
ncbi:MAG: hypothetical protein JSV52_05460 [Candidatus Zixiibacteriota bacterium]|nr:MAG: hypothetical protein JSV52_05460 [candidate division Zixibacteria bacterium]